MSTPEAPRPEPTPAEEVFAAYTWSRSAPCYRCGRMDVETATVGRLEPGEATIEVPACPSCLLYLERLRERAAHRYGWPYRPGTPADCR